MPRLRRLLDLFLIGFSTVVYCLFTNAPLATDSSPHAGTHIAFGAVSKSCIQQIRPEGSA
jgi:hypothetical protein